MGDTSLSVPETSLSIRELKQELARRGIDCGSCVEKRELVQLLHDASAPASKRTRPTPSPPVLTPSTTTTTTCAGPCDHEAAAIRRLRAALPRSFLPKEPDPERLFEAHAAPPLHGDAHLRIATWNLLETVTGPNDPRGIHAVFDVRRINVLRLLLALDADVVILQELCKASRAFLTAVMPSHSLVGHFLLRTSPRPRCGPSTRAVWLEPLAAEERCAMVDRSLPETRKYQGAKQSGPRGYMTHLPVRVCGLPGAPLDLVLASTHLALFKDGQMDRTDKQARAFLARLGRELLRLPTRHCAPMVLGGDFNTGKGPERGTEGKGSARGTEGLYELLVGRRKAEAYDSEDEWSEDEGELRWPPLTPAPVRLARDLWREPPEAERNSAGLQRGSTAIQYAQQSEPGQGLRVRARKQGWPDDGPCTDSGHIDWLLTAHEHAKGQASVRALRVGVATELMVPPLPPRQPSEVPALPPGGCIFPSDHYPVFADVQLVPRARR